METIASLTYLPKSELEQAIQTVELWIIALRSGKYTQGFGQLKSRDESCVCALGVLCNILPTCGSWELDICDGGTEQWMWIPNYAGNLSGVVTQLLRGSVGVRSTKGEVSIMTANDTLELTFPEIADLLEADLNNLKQGIANHEQ